MRLAVAVTLAATAALAQDVVLYDADMSFDDATFAVENAIIGQGLVVDHVSHTGEMLERTKTAVGGTQVIFDGADIFLFCSASLSRKVMEADPLNVMHCPYSVFVYDRAGAVKIGYRTMPDGPMKEVQALLDRIAREAAEGF